MLLAVEVSDVAAWLGIICPLLFLIIIPWVISVEKKLSGLDSKLNNGISKNVENLGKEQRSQRKEHEERLHNLEIFKARTEGQAEGSGIHGS